MWEIGIEWLIIFIVSGQVSLFTIALALSLLMQKLKTLLFCKNIINSYFFLIECSLYKEERQIYLNTIYVKFPNVKPLEPKLLLLWLMSCEDREVCILTAKFIFECFNKRGHSPNLPVNN